MGGGGGGGGRGVCDDRRGRSHNVPKKVYRLSSLYPGALVTTFSLCRQLEYPLFTTWPRSGLYTLPHVAAILTCIAMGNLSVELVSDATDAPVGGGAGGGPALSSLGMMTRPLGGRAAGGP